MWTASDEESLVGNGCAATPLYRQRWLRNVVAVSAAILGVAFVTISIVSYSQNPVPMTRELVKAETDPLVSNATCPPGPVGMFSPGTGGHRPYFGTETVCAGITKCSFCPDGTLFKPDCDPIAGTTGKCLATATPASTTTPSPAATAGPALAFTTTPSARTVTPSPSTAKPSCFSGESTVEVQGRGAVPMMTLKVGEKVLVETHPMRFQYAPVLAFLHVVAEVSRALEVTLANGHKLKASDNHLVFVATGKGAKRMAKRVDQVDEGDLLYVVAPHGHLQTSAVASVRRVLGSGMFAPLTSAGTVVVENIVASTYAAPGSADMPHGAAHAAFFPLRTYFALGLPVPYGWLSSAWETPKTQTREQMHPYAAFMYSRLGLAKLLL